MPGYLKSTDTFFRVYKLPQGKKENDIAFNGEAKDKVIDTLICCVVGYMDLIYFQQAFATDIVLETHHHWELLINGTTPRQDIQT